MANCSTPKVVKTKYGTYSLHYYTPGGRRRRLTVGSDEKAAQRLAVKFTDWLLDGKDPEREMERAKEESRARSITLLELYPIFMDKHGRKQSENMQELYYYNFRNISRCPAIAEAGIGEIRQPDLYDYMDIRMSADGVKPATVNREATMVRTMLNFAVKRGMLDRNPLQGFKLLKEDNKRDVRISPEQVAALIEALPGTVGDIVEFAVNTGFRKENVLSLRIEQVRFLDTRPGGEVDLYVKGGRWETKPLNANALEALKRAIGSRKEGCVFLNPETGDRYHWVGKTFSRVAKSLGLRTVAGDTLCFHDLRRIFANWMLEGGAGLEAVQYFLGHRSITTTTRYVTPSRQAMGRVLEVLPAIRKAG